MPNFQIRDSESGLCCIVGHVGKNPTLTTTQSGKRVAKFTMATNFQAKDGTVDTTWHSCVCWEEQADAAMQLSKGQVACVVGKEVSREYQGKTYVDLNAWFVGSGFKVTVPSERQPDHGKDETIPF